MYDVIIVGCGPAGMTSAIYLLREGKKVLILEKETIGGKIASSFLVQNYPGFKSISGAALANSMYEQVIDLGGIVEIEEVLEVVPGKVHKVVTDIKSYEANCVIIAGGSSNRLLGLDRESDFIGNGISFCTVCDGAFYKDKTVCVVGGGNTALVNALSLAHLCKKVYVLVRKDKFKGDKKRIEDVLSTSNIEVMFDTVVDELIGDDDLEGIMVLKNGEKLKLDLEGIFVSIGQDANTDFLNGLVNLSENNYIVSDHSCKTNVKGIFACGDILDKEVRQLTTAVSDGTIAAIKAIEYLSLFKI